MAAARLLLLQLRRPGPLGPLLGPAPRRYRHKKKWAATAPRVPSTALALQNFDMNYSLQLGEAWPSVRASLLSEQKYGALVNGFADVERVTQELELVNAVDFVSQGLQKAQGLQQGSIVEPAVGEQSASQEAPSERQAAKLPPPSALVTPNVKCYTFPRGDITRFRSAR
uniref:Uncharacterized protein n=1 Tax=Nothoprocta perdicaria TaxID=30464 RepID=A0A8C7A4N1_NOTPE